MCKGQCQDCVVRRGEPWRAPLPRAHPAAQEHFALLGLASVGLGGSIWRGGRTAAQWEVWLLDTTDAADDPTRGERGSRRRQNKQTRDTEQP